jgi:energy-coupling factor transporter ATP-binding protein EcfA2
MALLRGIHQRRGTTVVLVTHDADLAATADARIVLRDGRVVETHETGPGRAFSGLPDGRQGAARQATEPVHVESE